MLNWLFSCHMLLYVEHETKEIEEGLIYDYYSVDLSLFLSCKLSKATDATQGILKGRELLAVRALQPTNSFISEVQCVQSIVNQCLKSCYLDSLPLHQTPIRSKFDKFKCFNPQDNDRVILF